MTGNKGLPELDRMAVKIAHLDRLLGLTGEIIITASNMAILQRHLQSRALDMDKDSLEMVKSATLTANRISSDLHHLVMDIRLIPIKETFLRFRRLVRDLAKKKGRQINFDLVGEDTLVDKTVAERLYEPLAHQIRNAIDHGLEDPLERKAAGKDPKGQLTLTAYKKEGFTYVGVSDDGRGLSAEKIKRTAVDQGLLTPQAAAVLPEREAWSLIMLPGFSTTIEATEISGRGVGMDVVRNTVTELGGEVLIESQPGQGASFTYKIPQLSAVNITDALIIRAGQDYYAIPIGNVVATQAFSPHEIHAAMQSAECIVYLGAIIPIHDLRLLLSGRPLEDQADTVPVIIIEAKNGRVALKVSEFIRPQKLVLIPLPEIFSVTGVSGTTILGGNQLGLVLDPFQIISLATGQGLGPGEDRFLSRESVTMEDDGPAAETPDPSVGPPPVSSGLAVERAAEGKDAEPEAIPRAAEMDGRLAEEFFLEIQTILTDLNEEIFQLEKEPDSRDRLNTIFRHFHSIKGNLIMTGFAHLGAFVHQVEGVLDRLRDRELEVDQEIIDLLLDAAKQVETALGHIRAGRSFDIRDSELLSQIEKFKAAEPPPAADAEDQTDGAFRPGPLGQLLMLSKTARGAKVYQSIFHFKPRFQDPFLVAYLILKRLALVGDVIDTVPALDRIERGLVTDWIKVMFASRHDADQINRFTERQLVRYFSVTQYENLLLE
jgi:chemotaxis protein histidine kinase CheA